MDHEETLNLFQGQHEVEFCGPNEELDQEKLFKKCTKNPGHEGYIRFSDLSIENLPDCYQDNDIFQFIKCLGQLTVRLAVRHTSVHRPQFYPGAESPYPFYEHRGGTLQRLGSGRVWGLTKYSDQDGKDCPCTACKLSETPKKTWAYIMIVTATHVIYDKSEAEKVVCWVDYNDEKSKVYNLEGCDIGEVWVEEDRSNLVCVTHDSELVEKLEKTWSRFMELFNTVNRRYGNFADLENKLTVIVSHPHGGFKQVSIGQWRHKVKVKGLDTRFSYTAPTCPGSSGAFIFILGMKGWWYHHVHCGTNSGFNYSGAGWGF